MAGPIGLLRATPAFAANDGDGAETVSPTTAAAGATGLTFTFDFWNDSGFFAFNANSQMTITMPTGWTAPQLTNSANPGYTTIAEGAASGTNDCNPGTSTVSGQVLTIPMTCGNNDHLTITYGAAGTGTKVTTPSTTGTYTFTTTTRDGTTGTTNITTSPTVVVSTPAPTVTAVAPTSGTAAGGTATTITGTNFTGATGVKFGATSATSVVVVNATTITANAPAGTANTTVDVTVTGPAGTSATNASDKYTYASTPTVTSLSTNAGPLAGGTSTTITGTNFSAVSAVKFGATAATTFSVVNATSITATAPAGSGAVDVTVTNTIGTSATSAADLFTYWAAPTVTAVNPTQGPTTAGTPVSITGTNFSPASTVKFGANSATGVVVNSTTSISANAPAGGAGQVDVTVTAAGGISATNANDKFTYVAGPTVTAVSPNQGPLGGGTPVNITGTNFTGASSVTFGANPATAFTVNSATSISATAPAGSAGTVDVRVTTVGGTTGIVTADHFTYVAAPAVTSISPSAGPTGGGTQVTITGTDLGGATGVSFGGNAALTFVVNSATSITAYSPPGVDGSSVDVTVTTIGGTSPTGAGDLFSYSVLLVPTVASVSPAGGSATGGASVTITGTNFTSTAAAVSFGATPATSFIVVNSTTITATAPAHTAGLVDVTVTNSVATSATSAADQFTYVAPPTVTAVSPGAGPSLGGTAVTITGTDFTGASAVKFGATNAATFSVVDDNTISATSPAGTADATVDVTVVSVGGTSATSAADHFIFTQGPTISTVSPSLGALAGGTSVTITGTHFSAVSSVKFGATNATSFTVNSVTSITAVAPSGTGTVDITVTNPSSTSATSAADRFTYVAAPTVTAVSPSAGPLAGGTTVTVTGTNFTSVSSVLFGATAGFGVTTLSSTSLTVTSPAHAAGLVDITVVAAGGTSEVSATDQFTYAPVVTGVTSSTANGTYTTGASISIQVAFSSAVTVTGQPMLGLNDGGAASYTSGSGTSSLTFTYIVAGGQNTTDLDEASTSALTLSGGTIQSSGTDAVLTLPAPAAAGSLGANKAIVIDTTPPTVLNVSSPTANATYGTTAAISVQLTFSENVTVTGTPTLALNSGGSANYVSGSGSATLTFTYVVGSGQNAVDLDEFSSSALTLNGGTIRDAVNNAATLTVPAPQAVGSLGANKAITIDTNPHTCTWTGTNSTAWATAGNWSGCAGVVPQAVDSVVIPNVTNDPIFSTGTSTIAAMTVSTGVPTITGGTLNVTGDVTINAGASITFPSSGTGNLGVAGNFTNNGTFNSNNVSVTGRLIFNGTGAQTVSGTGTTDTRNLDFSGSSVTLQSNITTHSAGLAGTNTVQITSGTVDLGTHTLTGVPSVATLVLTIASGATLKVGASNFPSGYNTYTLNSGSTVEYNGASQTVSNAATYGTLKISGTGTKTLAGNTNVAGDLNIAGSTLDQSTFTVNRTAAGGTLTVANGAALKIGATNSFPTNYATHTLGASSTVEYAGANQTVSAETYGNLILSGSGTKTASILATTNVKGDFTKQATPTFVPSTSTYVLNGAVGQTVTGGPTFNNLTINNPSGVTLATGNLTVSGVLTLTSGVVSTGGNAVVSTSSAAGGVTGASSSSYVDGTLTRSIPAGAVSRDFAIGTGAAYVPATIAFASVTAPGTLTLSSSGVEHSSIATSDLNPAADANRFWTATPAGGLVFTTYDATFNFVPTDLDSGAVPANFVMRKFNSGTWTAPPGGSTATASATTGLGFTGFSDFVVGQLANHAPVATSFSNSVNEDGSVQLTLTGTDSDGDNTTFSIVGSPSNGTLDTPSSPSCGAVTPRVCTVTVNYTPAANYNGSDSFTYTVNDGALDSASATASLTVNAVNDAPSFTVGSDQTVNEDAGAQSVPTWATAISAGPGNESGQSVSFNVSSDNPGLFSAAPSVAADGTLSYTPDANANGVAVVTVSLSDDGGTANGGVDTSGTQQFQITVNAVNDAPVASGDSFSTNEDTQLSVNAASGVLSNDSDVDSPSITAALVDDVQHGVLALAADGSFTYTPTANYNGSDSFTYQANDGSADSNVVTVDLTVDPVNDAPSFSVGSDQSVNEDAGAQSVPAWATAISAGPADESGQALTFNVSSDNPGLFSAAPSVAADGTLSYTPDANANGVAVVTVSVSDDGGTANGGVDTSGTQQFTITVGAVNDAPVAVGDSFSTNEDTPLSVNAASGVLSNDSDVDSPSLTAALVDDVAHGVLALAADGSFTYTPTANFQGVDSFTYMANDGSLDSNVVTVDLTVGAVNDAPSFTVGSDQSVNEDAGAQSVPTWATDISAGPADESGQALTFNVSSDNPGLFSAGPSVAADGTLSYTPDANANGVAVVTVSVSDDGGTANGGVDTSGTQQFQITVGAVNDAPSFSVGSDQSVNEDAGAQSVPTWATAISAGPADESGQALTFNVSSDNPGLFSAGPSVAADGTLSYTPDANANGVAVVTVSVSDDGGTANGGVDTSGTQQFQITVNAVNDAPVAVGDSFSTNEDTPLSVNAASGVLSNDSDGDSPSLTAVLVDDVQHGVLALNADGSFTYTPAANFQGVDSFTYMANDGSADSNVVTVDLTVGAVNDAPSFSVGSDQSVNEDAGAQSVPTWATAISAGPADESGQALTFNVSSDNPGLFSAGPSVAADGTLSYTPDANANGVAVVTVSVSDDGGTANGGVDTSGTQQFQITVNAVNDAPVAVGDSFSTNEDTPLSVNAASGVLSNDSDGDSPSITAVLVDDVQHGVLALAADGSFTYTPAANYNGSDSFTYQANDGSADSNVVTVDLTVDAVNDAPVASGDSFSTNEDTQLSVNAASGVLANDSDGDSPSITAVLVDDVQHGVLALAADGSFTYTPAANYNGSDSFTYKANDGSADSNVVTVDLTVDPVNDAPVATGDSFSTNEDTQLSVNAASGVLANDSDGDSPSLTAVLVDDVQHGVLALAADGSFTYTPAANYNGSDSFTYKASDGSLDSNVVTVDLTVDPVNDAPVASGDSFSTSEDTQLVVNAASGVLANDSDGDSPSLTAVLVDDVQHGVLALASDGSFTYTPAANYNGSDSFTYKASDGSLDSNVVTVDLTVDPVNDAPVASGDSFSTSEDTQLVVNAASGVLANDSDGDSPSLTAVLVDDVQHGVLALASDGSFTYTPAANYNGSDSFTYQANDGSADSNVVTVDLTVDPVNDAPSFTVGSDQSVNEDAGAQSVPAWATAISAGPADESGQALTFNVSSDNPGLFSAGPSVAADGTLSYTPAANANGVAVVTVSLSDNGGGNDTSGTQQFTITVDAVNDAPVAVGDSFSTNEDTPLSVNAASGVLSNDSDVDSPSLTAVLVDDVQHGVLALAADGSFTYTPAANYNGSDSFTYQANDGSADSNVVTVDLTVDPVNDAPVATGDSFSTNEDTQLSVNAASGVLSNDSDGDSPSITAVLVDDVQHGVLALAADGSFTYTPAANYNGSDSFTYKANDGSLDSNVVTVDLTVNAVNDAPSFTVGSDQTVNEDSGAQSVPAWATAISAGPADESGQALTFNASSDNPGLFSDGPSVAADGTLTYTSAANANGSATVTLSVSDDGGTANGGVDTSATQTFTITVNAVDDAPTISSIANQTINEDTSTGALAVTVGDIDSSVPGLVVTGSSSDTAIIPNGNVVIGGSGANRAVTVTPAANQNGGPVTITVNVSDGTTTVPTTFTVTVTPVNDAPTLAHIGDQSINELSNLAFTAVGSDIDVPAQTLTYSLAKGVTDCGSVTSCNVPSGASIDGSTGAFSWTPDATQGPGTYRLKVRVSDGVVQTAEEITITVNDVIATDPKLVFTSAPVTTGAQLSSGLITIQRQTYNGVPQTTGALSVSLSSTSATGVFRGSADVTTITTINIAAGQSSVSFRYRDSLPGTPTMTVSAAGYTSATQDVTVMAPQLVFLTAPQSTQPGVSTGIMTVEREAYDGTPMTSGGLSVGLSSTAVSGGFRNSGDTNNITAVNIPNGSSSASFRYKDSAAGTPTITAAAATYTSAAQVVTIVAPPVLVITTAPVSTTPGVVSDKITVERRSPIGTALTSGELVVNLTSTNAGGVFWDLAQTHIITSVTIHDTRSFVSFRYQDSAVGTPTITTSAAGFTSASQIVTVANPPKLVFTSAPVTTSPNVNSGVITIQRQSLGGTPLTAGALTVTLATSSATGQFRNKGGAGVITTVKIANAKSSASFRYRDTAAGTPTITVSAATYTSGSQIETVDAPPTITGLAPSYSTPKNTPLSINITVGDADNGAAAVTLNGSSSNTAVIFNNGVTFTGSGAARQVVVTPRAGKTGSATITVTASDGIVSTVKTFTVTVTG